MPACVTFDPGTQLFPAGTYESCIFDSSNARQFLDPKRLAAALFSLPPQQLLTPPSSPEVIASAPFDQVPYEILDQILGLVHDNTARRVYDALRDISACCLVSRQFHAVGINWLYRHVPISDPHAFTKVIPSKYTLTQIVFGSNLATS